MQSEYFIKRRVFLIFYILFLAVSISAGQNNMPTKHPDRIILNLAENTSTSIAVTWRTDQSITAGFCELQVSPEGPVDQKNSKLFKAKTTSIRYEFNSDRYPDLVEPVVEANNHSHIFVDLVPGEKYIYRVGAENFWSEWFEFQMPEPDDDHLAFLFFGDPQSDLKSQWSRIIRRAYRHEPNSTFMLYGGDIINRAGRDSEWHEWFGAGSFIYATVPQIMTPGNHDYNNEKLDPHWNAQFTLPANGPKGLEGTCYVIDYKNLRIISIDSAADSELRNASGYKLEAQKTWLDSVLRVNTKEWVIVTTHLPFYSPKENRDNKHLREHFQPILEKHKVDMVLSGHDHSYGRGKETDNPENGHKVMYVVSVSGPKMYEAGDKKWMDRSGSFKQMYQVININKNVLDYKAYTANGELYDVFTLIK